MGWRRAHLLLMRGVLVPLAQVFITWLRDSTSAPDVLKSAAHAMKHSVQRQASTDCKLPPSRTQHEPDGTRERSRIDVLARCAPP